MELNDLKQTWNNAGSGVPGTQTPDTALVENTRHQKYRSRLKRITIPETVGSIVCLAAALFIGLSFDKLDTTLFRGAGALSIALLAILPIISYLSTWRLSGPRSLSSPHAETLQSFAMQEIRFVKLQKLNVALSYLLMVTIIVLLPKLFNGTDVSDSKYFWIFSFTIGYIFLLFYSKWVQKHYRQVLRQAQELLLDLEGKSPSST